ncbi:unnamed protein product [Mesocestoides corti]|uniref:mitogen-activated protein kinase kinase n=2 Tax=Mesocestoides corti TaxID=53468 RepID=A0A0R3UJD9_MESCO|nr:unnamed protein product [Mesocestoides corti]
MYTKTPRTADVKLSAMIIKMSGLTNTTLEGGGNQGDNLETSRPCSSSGTKQPPSSAPQSGLRFAGKRQVVIQNLDLAPLRLDDPPASSSSSNATATGKTSNPSRVRLPPLSNLGANDGGPGFGAALLRHDRAAVSKSNDRMSTGPVDLAAAQRQLDDQQLDDSQRERIEEFLRCKKDIHELHPEDFTKISELGSGNWGVVSRVRYNRSSIIMAKKTIRLDIKHEVGTQILRELEILHDCASPYIIGFYGAFLADGNINICMEYMDGGSLDMVLKHAGRMPEPIVSRILYAVLCGLEYLRKQLSMIHRDVKPSNILMRRNGEIKLCDFGASGKLIDSVAHSFVGSRSYMAPERISGQSYNTSSDVWSLGLTLIELATGHYPIPAIENESQYHTGFSDDRQTNLKEHISAAREGRKLPPVTTPEQAPLSIFELLVLIVEQPLPKLPRTCFSDDFIDLVASCLRTDSTERPSLETLQQHPFVTTVAGLLPAGANRRSSIRFRDSAFPDAVADFNMDDIAFYLSHILPPHDGIG